MKCYFHEERDAVGLCMTCGRAVCRQCGVFAGGRLHCESCYVETNLDSQGETAADVVQAKEEGKKELRGPLLGIGFLGSIVGVLMPVLSFVLQTSYSWYTFEWVFAVLALFAGLWLVPQAVGFIGIYKDLSEPVALVAGVFGMVATAMYIAVGAVAALLFSGYYVAYVLIYIASVYIIVTVSVQAATLLVVRRYAGHDMLLISTAIVLLAAGSISWLSFFSLALCASNFFLALCFWKLRRPSVAKAVQVQPAVDPLKELL